MDDDDLDGEGDAGAALGSVTLGSLGEVKAIAALIARGYKVAKPVVDDDGVDLIVGYHITVQIKTSANARSGHDDGAFTFRVGRRSKAETRPGRGAEKHSRIAAHVDVVMLHALAEDLWWIVPARIVREFTGHMRFRNGAVLDRQWRDAWSVFDSPRPRLV